MSRIALLDVTCWLRCSTPIRSITIAPTTGSRITMRHAAGWATCPVTENGFVRVLSNPAYGAAVSRPADLVGRLRRFCASGGHTFWSDAVSLHDEGIFVPARLRGYRQITDIYLLGLAVTNGGCLATCDGSIPLDAVPGATAGSLHVIAPAPRVPG